MSDFELKDWYASDAAKRSLGTICQAVNEQGATIYLLGTEDKPLLVLADADEHKPEPSEIEISIDEAKADWPNITTAAAIYGTRFRIRGKKVVRAVLYRNPAARHPAERYFRSSSADADRLARQIEALAKDVRQLGQKLARLLVSRSNEGLDEIAKRLDRSADIIDRRFREAWRLSNNYPA
jgi:hypothetical protein